MKRQILPEKKDTIDHGRVQVQVTLQLATDLIAEQFPQWAHLPITPVEFGGSDNKTFHLGEKMSIRLP